MLLLQADQLLPPPPQTGAALCYQPLVCHATPVLHTRFVVCCYRHTVQGKVTVTCCCEYALLGAAMHVPLWGLLLCMCREEQAILEQTSSFVVSVSSVVSVMHLCLLYMLNNNVS